VTHLWAVVLGMLQGLAEFLPISSTAHLKLIPWLFQVRDPVLSSSAFDIALHAGSLVAILAVLGRDWADLFSGAIGRPSAKTGTSEHHDVFREPTFARKFLGFLVLTSIPGALFGVAFDAKLEFLSTPDVAGRAASGLDAATFHYAPLLLASCLMSFGVLLWAADRFVTRMEPLETMNWSKALVIGIAQAAALIPGVSRSGSTMTAGRLVGLDREAVARYSFMAAAPIIGGAVVFGLRDVPLSELFSLDWGLGFTAAAISSALVMRWMLDYVKRHSFAIFMWYRIAFGALVAVVFFLR
jgi:undecaprenyl-diphosphatase